MPRGSRSSCEPKCTASDILAQSLMVRRRSTSSEKSYESAMTEAHRDAVIKDGQRPVTLTLLIVCAALVSLFVSPNPYGVLGALFGCLALMIAYVDSRNFIIPDWLTGAGLLLGHAGAVALRAQN